MPFKSDAQRRYLFAFHPQIAKRFADETPKGADLPDKKGSQSKDETRKYRLRAMKHMMEDKNA